MRRRVLATFLALTAASSLLATSISAPAVADNDDDPLCYTTRSSVGSGQYQGDSASRVYDWHDYTNQDTRRFVRGVPIPQGLLDERYVPQGLTAWPNWNGTGEDVLLISAYKQDDWTDDDLDGPSGVWGVITNGSRQGQSLGRMLIKKGHVGGIAAYQGYLYVGSGKEIRGYKLSRLRSVLTAANNSHIYPRDYTYPASYTVGFLGTGDGRLWAGRFDQNKATHLNAYTQTSTAGRLTYRFQWYAPKKTQGVAVTGNRVVFATSYGRNDRSNLWIMAHGQTSRTDANSTCFRAPSMVEGITFMSGRFYALYESGAWHYNKTPDDPDNPIYHLHSALSSRITGLYANLAD